MRVVWHQGPHDPHSMAIRLPRQKADTLSSNLPTFELPPEQRRKSLLQVQRILSRG